MKNLRKVLALVLVVASLMSMAIVANADFTDVDKISQSNKEAVDVLSALDIIGGYTDGSYQPKKVVTRAEMAKMIATILNSGKDINDLYKASCTFADSKNHWAAGYIGYCATMGIIGGRSADVFDPNATVTGVEAAKMVLCSLKYKAEAEGFTGTNWKGNVLNAVDELDLYDRISTNPDEGMTRENAAQLLWNGLKQDIVKYKGGSSITVDGVTFVSGGERESTNETLLANEFPGVSSVRGYNEWFQPITTITIPGEDDIVIVDTPDIVTTKRVKNSEIYKLVGNIKGTDLAKNGITVNLHASGNDIDNANASPYFWYIVGCAANTTTYTQGDGTELTGIAPVTSKQTGMTSSSSSYIGSNGDLVEVYWDADAKVLDVLVFWSGASKIDSVVENDDDTTSITTVGDWGYGSAKSLTYVVDTAETTFTEDNEGDVVIVSVAKQLIEDTANPGTMILSGYNVYRMIVPTVVTGTSKGVVQNTAGTTHSTLYLDDKSYTCDNNIDVSKSGAFTVGEEFNVYLDEGNIAHAFLSVVETAAPKYAYVIAVDTEKASFAETTNLAQVLFADGVVEVIETDVLATVGQLCTYTVDKKNVYTLTMVDDTTDAVAINKGKAPVGNNYFANDNTVFVVETTVNSKPQYDVYTGIKNVPSLQSTNILVVENEFTTGLLDLVYCLSAQLDGTNATTDLDISMLYVPSNLSKYTKPGVDGTAYSYYSAKAWINGAATTVKLTPTVFNALKASSNTPAALALIKGYSLDENGCVESVVNTESTLTAISSGVADWSNGVITINGAKTYIEKGTPVYFYERNSSALEKHTIEELNVSEDSKETIQGGWYLTDSNGTIIAVYGMGKIS